MPESNTTSSEKERIGTLLNRLATLNSYLRKRTSYKYLFSYAIIQGIGYVIGATIIASIVVAILARVVITVDEVPWLNQVLNAEQFQENYIQQSQ